MRSLCLHTCPTPCACPYPLQTFHGDFNPEDRDFRLAAAQALGELRGKPVSDEVLRRVVAGEEVRGARQVLASKRLKGAGLDSASIIARVEQQQAEEQQRRQQQIAAA